MKMVKCLPEFEYFTVFLKYKKKYFKNKKIKSFRLCSFKKENGLSETEIIQSLNQPSMMHVMGSVQSK